MFTPKPSTYTLTMFKDGRRRAWKHLSYNLACEFASQRNAKGWITLSLLAEDRPK